MFEYIKSKDVFGHKIELNFNKKGPFDRTILGGLVTILIQSALLVLSLFLFKDLMLRDKD